MSSINLSPNEEYIMRSIDNLARRILVIEDRLGILEEREETTAEHREQHPRVEDDHEVLDK